MRSSHPLLAILIIAPLILGGCSSSTSEEAESSAESEPAERVTANGEMISLPSGEDEILAYLATPAGPARGRIIVIQEWWGLSDWIKTVTDRFAQEGYIALAPDLYRGQVATEAEHAHELMRGLPDGRAISDILAASAYLDTEFADSELKMGVIGFCMGGRLSLLASLEGVSFDATVICYGRPEVDADRLTALRGPVLGIFGGEDRGIGLDQVETFEKDLDAAGTRNEILVLNGAGHAFLNDTRQSFAPDAAEVAWGHIDQFFEREVAGGS
jgi:carboxymethylenebutenolidase